MATHRGTVRRVPVLLKPTENALSTQIIEPLRRLDSGLFWMGSLMRNISTDDTPTAKDLVLNWLDEHTDDIGIVQCSVRELAQVVKRSENTIKQVLCRLKAERQLIEYTLHRGLRVFRLRRPPSEEDEHDDSLQLRTAELEELTEHDRKLRPLIEQFATTEQTIADIDREIGECEPGSKDRHTLRQDRAQQVLNLLRLSKEIGLSFSSNKTASVAQKHAPSNDPWKTELPQEWPADPATFAEESLGITLRPHQQEFCNARRRIVVMIAGRGAGKSTAARVFATFTACRKANHTVLVVSSGQRMSSDFGRRINELIQSSRLKDYVKSSSASRIDLQNGSSIVLLPAKPDTIRGYHPKRTPAGDGGLSIILDEACFMEQGEEIRTAVEYALITTAKGNGQMVIASSPSSVHSWVYPLFLAGQEKREDIISFRWASTVNPDIGDEEIERLRETRTDLEFRAEVLAEWVSGSHSLFGGMIVEAIGPGESGTLYDGEIATLGADLALSYDEKHDASAFVVLARLCRKSTPGGESDLPWPYVRSSGEANERSVCFRVVDVVRLSRASTKTLLDTALGLVKRYGIAHTAVEQYQGKALHEFLAGQGVETELVAPTAATQEIIFNDLYNLFRGKLITIPEDFSGTLIEELKTFEYRRGATGRFSFGHPPGSKKIHDDTVYALAWALYAQRRAFGDVQSPPPAVEFF